MLCAIFWHVSSPDDWHFQQYQPRLITVPSSVIGSKVIGQLHTGHDVNGQSVLNTQGALPFNLLMGLIIFPLKTDHLVVPALCAGR